MRLEQAILLTIERMLRGFRRRLFTMYYSSVLKSMGRDCQISDGVKIFGAENITIGDYVIVNEGVVIQSCDGAIITIGNRVGLSYGAYILTGGLDIEHGVAPHKHVSAPIVIEDGAWIGAGAILLSGVTVGTGAVVAAGAVVTHDVAPYVVVVGASAKVHRTISSPEKEV